MDMVTIFWITFCNIPTSNNVAVVCICNLCKLVHTTYT